MGGTHPRSASWASAPRHPTGVRGPAEKAVGGFDSGSAMTVFTTSKGLSCIAWNEVSVGLWNRSTAPVTAAGRILRNLA